MMTTRRITIGFHRPLTIGEWEAILWIEKVPGSKVVTPLRRTDELEKVVWPTEISHSFVLNYRAFPQ